MEVEPLYTTGLLENTMELLDSVIDGPFILYLLGGSAMLHAGSKTATKDIDLVIREYRELGRISEALGRIGFTSIENQTENQPQEEQKVTAVHLEGPNGLRFDIFIGSIAGKLVFSDTMRDRAHRIRRLRYLEIMRLSNEDLFLLKSVTGRDEDLDDMSRLFEAGLEWDIIISELDLQMELTGRVWEVVLLDSLFDLEKEYGLVCPRIKEISEIAEDHLQGYNGSN